MMFDIRKLTPGDTADCAMCLYESFFDCPLNDGDRRLLSDYANMLMEFSSFAYAAEKDGQVAGFITGSYGKRFSRKLYKRHDLRRHYGTHIWHLLKFAFGGYKLSAQFKEQFALFFKKIRENGKDTPLECDCELQALCSRSEYRKGLGTALWNAFAARCKEDGAKTVRVFTNTASTYMFYEKRGFKRIWEKPYSFGASGSSFVYEYKFE